MAGTIFEQGDLYVLDFRYNPSLVSAIKEIPNRRFNHIDKTWTVPKSEQSKLTQLAKKYHLSFGDNKQPEQVVAVNPLPELTIDIPLKRELYPFQKNGVAYNLKHKRVLVGDLPGLGKTTQAFATIIAAESFPCLVVCPNSLKENWRREIEQFTYRKAIILQDNIRNSFPLYYEAGVADFFIVNYESLKKYFVLEIKKPDNGRKATLKNIVFDAAKVSMFKSMIIDESHRVKAISTMAAKFCKGIATGKEYILALSGTPVINKPKDLVSQLGIIDQFSVFGNYSKFMDRYCAGPKEASNLKELNSILANNCFYQRKKEEVLKDLPEKTRNVVLCDISTRKEYNDALADLAKYLKDYKEATDEQIMRSMRGEVMVRIGVLKNISARGKMKEVAEHVHDLIDQNQKVVVFAHLKEVIAEFKKVFSEAVSITGDDSLAQRQFAVDRFQNDPTCKIIVCNIKAGGVGITLTASSYVSFIELPWHAADCTQCEDRCHRISQKDNVTCTYFLGKDTIDEWIYQIIASKRDIAGQVTGNEDNTQEIIIDKLYNLFNQN